MKIMRKLVVILSVLILLPSCKNVRLRCTLITSFYNNNISVKAKLILNKEWDTAYYFSYTDDYDEIANVLGIKYDRDDFVDVGKRFIFLSDNNIVHQEIYWDSYFYHFQIPEMNLSGKKYIKFIPNDTIRIEKKKEVFEMTKL